MYQKQSNSCLSANDLIAMIRSSAAEQQLKPSDFRTQAQVKPDKRKLLSFKEFIVHLDRQRNE